MDDQALVERILAGDRAAFREIVQRHNAALERLVRYYVKSDATAQDVVQDTWIAVLRGLSKFEGRSSFKTWLLRIGANLARKTGSKERRIVPVDPVDPFSSARFNEGGMWTEPPAPFTEVLEDKLANAKALEACRKALAGLPEPQHTVVTLRDVEGLSTKEVSRLLELTDANTRVLLHRGRAKIREIVETELKGGYPWQ
jgi:RNA polymerase sigma-70 factor (ECF subfamily)